MSEGGLQALAFLEGTSDWILTEIRLEEMGEVGKVSLVITKFA
jgi:hypothetical protein